MDFPAAGGLLDAANEIRGAVAWIGGLTDAQMREISDEDWMELIDARFELELAEAAIDHQFRRGQAARAGMSG